jgi:hypothetical protein
MIRVDPPLPLSLSPSLGFERQLTQLCLEEEGGEKNKEFMAFIHGRGLTMGCMCVCAIESPKCKKRGLYRYLGQNLLTTNLVMVCKIMNDFIPSDREV